MNGEMVGNDFYDRYEECDRDFKRYCKLQRIETSIFNYLFDVHELLTSRTHILANVNKVVLRNCTRRHI